MMAANRFVIFFWDEYEERGMMGSGPRFVLFSFAFWGGGLTAGGSLSDGGVSDLCVAVWRSTVGGSSHKLLGPSVM